MRAAALLPEVIRWARQTGTRVFLVGGAVRDSLLKKPVKDFDIAVSEGEAKLARHLESGGRGRAFPLSRAGAGVSVWRVAGPSGTIDIARLEGGGSPESDLARRDFTVNAMARDLLTGILLDPYGGQADLRRGVVRVVSEKNLAHDPLRILRAYRIAATHGWTLAPGTSALLRRRAGGLRRTAAERIHEELCLWLGSARPAATARRAAADGVLGRALGLPGHLPWVGAAAALRTLDGPGGKGKRALADRLAALFLRLGLSPRRAARALSSRKFSREEIRSVSRRLEFLQRSLESSDPRRVLFDFRMDLPAFLPLLSTVARGARQRRRVARVGQVARMCRRKSPPVDGHDLRNWFSLPEGEELGRLLREAAYRYFVGDWPTRGEIRRRLEERQRRRRRIAASFDVTRPVR